MVIYVIYSSYLKTLASQDRKSILMATLFGTFPRGSTQTDAQYYRKKLPPFDILKKCHVATHVKGLWIDGNIDNDRGTATVDDR